MIVTHSELILRRLVLDKIIICREGEQELFLGTYDDFLERSGWDEEEGGKPKKKSQNDRQERAEHVQARSREIRPLKEDMDRTEALIATLEKQQEQAQKLLIEATPNPTAPRSRRYPKRSGSGRRRLTITTSISKILMERLSEVD